MVRVEEITKLIWLKQEGPYWDFKRQWYKKGDEGDMLHDILCMANNLENRDAYIIIGVDEEQDYSLVEVQEDPYRRNTQMLTDFLRDKKFAGDIRPVVTVESILVTGITIDVIVIHNSDNTPFFIKEKFNKIPGPNIYTRIQDTNTPVNRSADLTHIEYLWKKRFGLLAAPIDRIQILLQDQSNWEQSTGFDTLKYYKYSPEYTISYPLDDPLDRHGYEFYLLNQCDYSPMWTIIELKYHQTILTDMGGVILDGGRHITSCPLHDGIFFERHGSWDVSYCYFVKGSLEYCVHEFYFDKNDMDAVWADRKFMENVLLFETEDEHQLFNYYIEQNWNADKYTNKCFLKNVLNLMYFIIMQKMFSWFQSQICKRSLFRKV